MKLKLTTLLAITLVSGCASMQSRDPYTGEVKVNNTTKGAAIGTTGVAALGAGIGAIICGGECAALGAMAGAGTGLLVGGGTGYYLDQQETELTKRLVGTGVQVQRQGDNLKLIMPSNVLFGTDLFNLDSRVYPVLNSVIEVLREFDETELTISGFTDSTGSFKHNQLLSENRALSVANYFNSNGIQRNRMRIQGLGERFPISNNKTKHGRALNRRVELNIERY